MARPRLGESGKNVSVYVSGKQLRALQGLAGSPTTALRLLIERYVNGTGEVREISERGPGDQREVVVPEIRAAGVTQDRYPWRCERCRRIGADSCDKCREAAQG